VNCCNLYAHPAVNLLLGESWHPGGLALTRRTIERAGTRGPVLDVACGGNRSVRVLREMGIRAIGMDAGKFEADVRGDAHRLPFSDGSFDCVLMECALSTFRDQAAALREARRVGRRVAISDMILERSLPESWGESAATLACLVHAHGVAGYRRLLESAGFQSVRQYDEREALIELLGNIRDRLLLLQMGGVPVERVREILAEAREMARSGSLGYMVFAAE